MWWEDLVQLALANGRWMGVSECMDDNVDWKSVWINNNNVGRKAESIRGAGE